MVNFKLIKPEDLWYAIGLITTDGNLSSDGRHISITSKDGDFLEEVKKHLLLKNKIGLKTRSTEIIKKYSFLQFGDVNFYRYLLEIGKFAAKVILGDIYYTDCLCLKRKMKKAQECLGSNNGLRKYGKVVLNWNLV